MRHKGELQRNVGLLLAALLLVACGGAEVAPSATAPGPAPSPQPTMALTAIPPASVQTEAPPAPTVAAHTSPVSPLPTPLAAARTPCDAGACVLFLGNSFTFVNDLPQIFAALAASGGHDVVVGISAQGGWTLADHVSSPVTPKLLDERAWDYVVLQEQSLIPAVPDQRQERMVPAARQLEAESRSVGAEPLLFLTWARRDGLPSAGFGDYGQMQAAIESGYLAVAEELSAAVAPVGTAWQQAAGRDPPVELWQADGLHPTKAGSYLAACVFYAVVTRESPEGLSYTGGLPEDAALLLQTIAAETVLQDPARWNLP